MDDAIDIILLCVGGGGGGGVGEEIDHVVCTCGKAIRLVQTQRNLSADLHSSTAMDNATAMHSPYLQNVARTHTYARTRERKHTLLQHSLAS